mgnify:FL=1
MEGELLYLCDLPMLVWERCAILISGFISADEVRETC